MDNRTRRFVRMMEGELSDLAFRHLSDALHNLKGRAAEQLPYLVLGVSDDDPDELVEQVFRVKAKFRHPDNLEHGDAVRFKELNNAYQIIKRKRTGS